MTASTPRQQVYARVSYRLGVLAGTIGRGDIDGESLSELWLDACDELTDEIVDVLVGQPSAATDAGGERPAQAELERLIALFVHANDSIHRHHDLDKATCSYCDLVGRYARIVIARHRDLLTAALAEIAPADEQDGGS